MEKTTNKHVLDSGLAIRREVIGAEDMDDATNTADAFTRSMREFVTEHRWGKIWARPGLPRKVRSPIDLTLLTALNRPDELKLHIRGALNNGVAKEEIMEVFSRRPSIAGYPPAGAAFVRPRRSLTS